MEEDQKQTSKAARSDALQLDTLRIAENATAAPLDRPQYDAVLTGRASAHVGFWRGAKSRDERRARNYA
jgi:hypothetical protein